MEVTKKINVFLKNKWRRFAVCVLFPMPVMGRAVRKNKEIINLRLEKITNSLRDAINCHDYSRINWFSRELCFAIEYIYEYPDLWPLERVQNAQKLLDRAADATKETDYHCLCRDRASRFSTSAKTLSKCKCSFTALIARV